MRARLFLDNASLFDSIKVLIDQTCSIINAYIPEKDYFITKTGFNSITYITNKYIDIKNGSFFPSSIIKDYNLYSDPLLNYIFERLAAFQRNSAQDKELEISNETIECFYLIAIKCSDIKYLSNDLNEYHHCMLATQYMQQGIEKCLNVDLLDIGISGVEYLKNIGLLLARKNASTNFKAVLDNLGKIATYGLIKQNASFLISIPLQSYSTLLREVLLNININDSYFSISILDKAKDIIIMYLMREESDSASSVNLDFSLGDFIDLSRSNAMPYVFNEINILISNKNTSSKEKQILINKALTLSETIWSFYNAILKPAAEKESFLIHFVNSNLFEITSSLLILYENGVLDDKQKLELLKKIGWIISNYWRIYHYHKKITRLYYFDILDSLLELGYKFNELKLMNSLKEIIDIILSIANSFLEKFDDHNGTNTIDIIEHAAYLCIFNGSEDLENYFINQLIRKNDKQECLWRRYITKFPKQKMLFFDDLLEIDPNQIMQESPHLSFREKLLSMLKKSQIKKFSNNVYNKITS